MRKTRLNDIVLVMQSFYFFVKFSFVLMYILKVYCRKSSSILLRKNIINSLVTFCFEEHVPSQVLKDFSVENLKTTPRSIYLELLIIGVVF